MVHSCLVTVHADIFNTKKDGKANLKTSDVGGVHIIKLIYVIVTNIDYNLISISSAEPYCVELSPLCPHSLP